MQQSDQRGFALKASVLNPVHRGKSGEDEVDRHHTSGLCQVDFLSLTAEWATQDLNGEGAKLVLGTFGSTLNLDAFDGDLNLARYPFVAKTLDEFVFEGALSRYHCLRLAFHLG